MPHIYYAINIYISQAGLTSNVGLFTVPTRIIVIVAPLNALLNYLLGELSKAYTSAQAASHYLQYGARLLFGSVSLALQSQLPSQ